MSHTEQFGLIKHLNGDVQRCRLYATHLAQSCTLQRLPEILNSQEFWARTVSIKNRWSITLKRKWISTLVYQ